MRRAIKILKLRNVRGSKAGNRAPQINTRGAAMRENQELICPTLVDEHRLRRRGAEFVLLDFHRRPAIFKANDAAAGY